MSKQKTKRNLRVFEQLQARELMAADFGMVGVVPETLHAEVATNAGETMNVISTSNQGNGQIEVRVVGSHQSDSVRVTRDRMGTSNIYDDQIVVRKTTDYGTVQRSYDKYLPDGGLKITDIVFEGLGGNDYFRNYTSITSTANGGEGNDYLRGGANSDVLDGGAGDDVIFGRGGHDTLRGSTGDDWIFGGGGADFIDGGWNADRIYAGDGNDVVFGGLHNDFIRGGDGKDTLSGDGGNDDISGGDQADTIDGGRGFDTISGDGGDDTINGGPRNDVITGGDGHDELNGDDGRDLIYGGDGHDRLDGGRGNDTLLGDDGQDWLYGGDGHDLLLGGRGDDYLYGNNDDDALIGGRGKDHLYGGFGRDTLSGGDVTGFQPTSLKYGSPRLHGYAANDGEADQLWGGAGVDSFWLGDNYWYTWGPKDKARDNTSVDGVRELYVNGWGFNNDGLPAPLHNFGHQSIR